jgi:putative SOS response-associated peptidase YedK
MTRPDGNSLAMAGLWTVWRDPQEKDGPPVVSTAVLTTAAQGQLADIHDRMPLLMTAEHWAAWLDPDAAEVDGLLEPSMELIEELELRPVSSKVNNVRNNGSELVARVEPATDLDDPKLF